MYGRIYECSIRIYIYTYVYTYIEMYMYMCICIYVYTYIGRERERKDLCHLSLPEMWTVAHLRAAAAASPVQTTRP